MAIVVALLIGTAFLKAFTPQESAVLQAAYEIPRWLVLATVQVELAAAAWLVSGWRPLWAKRSTQALFACFAAFSLYRAIGGQESCGCFGPIRVNPWVTASLDLAIVVALSAWRPVEPARAKAPRAWLAGSGFAASAVACGLAMTTFTPADEGFPFPTAGEIALLEPEEWVGQPFHLANFLDSPVDFEQGEWVVLIYHHDCPKCQEAKPAYERLAQSGNQVALVESPPFGHRHDQVASATRYTRLRGDREWFVQAPVEVRVAGGVVVGASLELPSIEGMVATPAGGL